MTPAEQALLTAIELHSIAGIQQALDNGIDINSPIQGKSVVNWLTEMYTRTSRFSDCLRLLLDNGAELDDPLLAPVLLNDAEGLKQALDATPDLLNHRTDLVSAFTPLLGAALLHVAAEYGHVDAARVLIETGADIEAKAATNAFGLNGHTPIFHTVNSGHNHSEPILNLLLDAGARTDVRLPGLTWGEGFDWETTFFDVTPISYAQLGLLPQVHRKEQDVYANVKRMLAASERQVPPMDNIPNRYLQPKENR